MVAQVRIVGGGSLRDLSRRLHAAGQGGLVRELRQEIVREGRPSAAAVKGVIRALPIRGFPKAGRKAPYRGPSRPKRLRARVAAAVAVQAYTGNAPGVRIFIRRGQLGADARLPDLMDGDRNWKHPIMGNRRAWVRQYSPPYWDKTLRKTLPRYGQAVDRAIDRTMRRAI